MLSIGLAVLLLVVVLLMRVGRRGGPSSDLASLPAAPQLPVAVAPTAPPLPPEGLPPGWTMEQWAWYGEDYLNNR